MKHANTATCALFLDLDGTLIDIAPTPDSVIIPDGLVRLLDDLTRCLDGALAIITGRPISDIASFLAPLAPVAAGTHGAELRMVSQGDVVLRAEPIDSAVVEAVRRLAEAEPGIIVEMKRASIAVHHRQVPAAGSRLEAALQRILDDGPDHLILCRGRKVLEIVPRHISKGAALDTLMCLPVFHGRRPIMIGDDFSDQSAFDAAHRLGGLGLRVAGECFAREVAEFEGPAQVRSWLSALAKGNTVKSAPSASEEAR
jgi:trehalose 6-phosphate phosphatase